MLSALLSLILIAPAVLGILIPAPDGPFEVCMSVTQLTDHNRLDPYAPKASPHPRSVVVSMFLPVNTTEISCNIETVPYMTPLVAQQYDTLGEAVGLPGIFSSMEMEVCKISSQRPACAMNKSRQWPLVLFSPGGGNPRLLYGAIARSLASNGYAVVTVDHPYDAMVVEFPDGRVIESANISDTDSASLTKLTKVRAEDMSFVLDQLHHFKILKTLTQGLPMTVNLDQIVSTGHSLGGATSATAMMKDKRILGGINFDGRLVEPVEGKGLDKPFVLVGRPGHSEQDPTWNRFWRNLRGPRAHLEVQNSTHGTFTDMPILLSGLGITGPAVAVLQAEFGLINWSRVAPSLGVVFSGLVDYVLGSVKLPPILTTGNSEFPEVIVLESNL